MVIRITGSLINAAAIVIGGGIGLIAKGRLSLKISENITRAIGLCVCIIGISGALNGDIMLMVASIALGTLAGEFLNIDGGLNRFGLYMQKKLSRNGESAFAEGFVTATLLFCVGAMAVIGSIDSGLNNDRSVLITKSMLDGVSSIAFASCFGYGVLFAAVPVLVYQGCIEFFAGFLHNILTTDLVKQISAVGSVMILGIGFNMSFNAKIRVANLLPGLIFAVGYYYLIILPR